MLQVFAIWHPCPDDPYAAGPRGTLDRLESDDGRRAVEGAKSDAPQEVVGARQDSGAARGELEKGGSSAANEEPAVPELRLAGQEVDSQKPA